MSTTAILLTIAAIIVIAIVTALAVRARRRTAARTHIGLPDIGALSTEGLDKEHTAHGAHRRSEQ